MRLTLRKLQLATITSRVEAADKVEFDTFCRNVGMNASTAINMFIKAVLREGRLPFNVGYSVPNEVTLAAIREAEEMEKHPEDGKSFSSIDELMEDLLG